MRLQDLVLPLILAAAAGRALTAQTTDSTPPEQPARHACFRGRPLPACHSFWITEFGLAQEIPVSADAHFRDGTLATWELGGMVNRGPRHALGVALFAHAATLSGIGIRPRLRTWLSPTVSVDFAPGIILSPRAGFSGQVALNLADYLAVTSHVLVLNEPYGHPGGASVRLYLGGRLGSVPGAVTGLAAPLIVLLAFFIACGGSGCD